MRLYRINPRVILINRYLSGLFAITVICIVLLTAGIGISSDPNGRISNHSGESVADGNNTAEDVNGPTVLLGYSREGFKKNPISSFMYFVPLISPTLVDRETSLNNLQQVGIISYKRKVTSKSFNVICEFEILGKGFHKNTFDPAEMIKMKKRNVKEGEPLVNLLDYIKFEGQGFGLIEVKGTITGSTPTVTEVNMQFNARGQQSPVTIGLYSVKPENGQYKYENRYDETIARVNTLSFRKTEKTPCMGIKVASISKPGGSEGFFSHILGAIVNLFISPPEVTKLGNQTMLDFGYALLKQKPEFTFPKAKNIQEDRMVVMNNKQKLNADK
jgi:hypothetical protein